MRSAENPETLDALFEQCQGYIQLQDFHPVFSALQKAAKQVQCILKLKIEIKNWTTRQNGLSGMDLGTFEVTIDDLNPSKNRYQLFNTGILENRNFADFGGDWVGKLSITGILYPRVFEIPIGVKEKQSNLNKNILINEIQWDIVIQAKDKDDIKAHRAFLCAHSSVFSAMFQESYQEFKTGVVDMTDMTEAGVRAFLAYLYYSDVKAPTKNCSTAVELLKAAHKYDISALQTEMKHIILRKRESWCNIEAAMELFLFSRNVEGLEELKMRSFSILQKNDKELGEDYK